MSNELGRYSEEGVREVMSNAEQLATKELKDFMLPRIDTYGGKASVCIAREFYKNELQGLRLAELVYTRDTRSGEQILKLGKTRFALRRDSILWASIGSIANIRVANLKNGRKTFWVTKVNFREWSDKFAPLRIDISKDYTQLGGANMEYLKYVIDGDESHLSELINHYIRINSIPDLKILFTQSWLRRQKFINGDSPLGSKPGEYSINYGPYNNYGR